MNIPKNDYVIEDDPRFDKLVRKCLRALNAEGTAFIDMTDKGDPDWTDIRCSGEGSEAIVRHAIRRFVDRNYHACLYYNGYCYLWAKISKIPFNRTNGVEILG